MLNVNEPPETITLFPVTDQPSVSDHQLAVSEAILPGSTVGHLQIVDPDIDDIISIRINSKTFLIHGDPRCSNVASAVKQKPFIVLAMQTSFLR